MALRRLCVAAALMAALVNGANPRHHMMQKRNEIRQSADQTAVTYDEHSLLINGERVIFMSGSFHPYRLPVPGLWRDIFEKIRAMGYNGVTFYINWALLEGKQGDIIDAEIFDLQAFFDAAKETGIWLNARPGPYINAEVSGGGFPGWQERNPAALRTDQAGYLNTTDLYMSTIGAILADAQITNGGPVILVQPENEYTYATPNLEPDYMAYVEKQLRDAGITVPLMSNDAYPAGNFVPGSGEGAVDIYGYDGYPLGFDCSDPTNWGSNSLPTNYGSLHEQQSPNTPNSIVEYQGGSFDPWGGVGFEMCAELLNWQFENVFYKNDFSMGVKMLNLYMTYGGYNWGNLGYDVGYSSYDYGAAIALNGTVNRQKYSEAKLIANSMRASPAFLTGVAQDNSNGAGAYTGNNDIFVSGVFDSSSQTKFFFQRQSEYYSTSQPTYTLTLPTSQGNISIPQLGGELSLNGRESKISVTDFDLGGVNLLYSSAEIFTWQTNGGETTLVVFGDAGQTHELAIEGASSGTQIEGTGATIKAQNNGVVINTGITSNRQIIQLDNSVTVHVVDRYTAYGYWVIYPTGFANSNLPIVNLPSGYLVRNVELTNGVVNITADLNQTTVIEVIGEPSATAIMLNGQTLQSSKDANTGILSATANFDPPSFGVADLKYGVTWSSIDGLPEIQPGYDDSQWPAGDLPNTNNTNRYPLDTPTSLYAGDYGFHTGSLIYRGHFTATGNETQLQLSPQGGNGFGYTFWLNDTYIGNWLGDGSDYYHYGYFSLPQLTAGANYVFTVVIDHMGLQENYEAGGSDMKQPRGVMQYTLNTQNGDSVPDSAITWKLTGNLGGEDYVEKELGPLNEGGFYAERQGYYLPGAPIEGWEKGMTPQAGINNAGVRFYVTTFDLDVPEGYTVPLALDFGDGNISNVCPVRVSMWVNGYQMGKYVSNIGPQTLFPAPEGVWNYRGSNTVAIQVWALTTCGGDTWDLHLTAGSLIQTGYGAVEAAPQPTWTARANAY